MNVELTPNEYMNVLLERKENSNKQYTRFISEAVLSGEIKATDIPISIMVSSRVIYISVFRMARSNCSLAVSIFKSVFAEYKNVCDNKDFIECLYSYLSYCDKLFGNEKEYRSFRDSIPKEILKESEL